MASKKTVHVTVKRRNAPAVAGDGNRANETDWALLAAGARAYRALPVVRPSQKVKPAGPLLTSNEGGGKIRIGHVEAAQCREYAAQRPGPRAERGWSKGDARRNRTIHVHEEKVTAAAGAGGSIIGQLRGAAPEVPERDLSGAPELLDGEVDDPRKLAVKLARRLSVPTGVVGKDRNELDIPNATSEKVTKGR